MPLESHAFVEELAKFLSDVSHAEQLRSSDVDDVRRRRRISQGLKTHRAGVRLPNGIKISHGQGHGAAQEHTLSYVEQDAITQFGSVVETNQRDLCTIRAAEMFEDALASKTGDRVFADGIGRVFFAGSAFRNRYKPIHVPR